jgi:D-arabinono-1,4-lactone oxidase
VNLARQYGKTIRVVGAAHSPSDIHCSSEWMISLDYLDHVLNHDLDQRRITIQAGMRLSNYIVELEKRGWCMDNLGSISEQSMAGAIATCTHGSSLDYGVISTQVESRWNTVDNRLRISR